jgi:hypothetical protein
MLLLYHKYRTELILMSDTKNEVAPFSVVKKAMVHFSVVKWPPNQIIVVRLKGDNGSDSDWKLVPNIIDK